MNKKRLILVYLLITSIVISCSSVTGIDDFDGIFSGVSDQTFDQNTLNLFRQNAEILAFRDQFKQDSSFIYLEEDLTEFYYDMQVYVASSKEGRNQSITTNTYIFEFFNLKELVLQPKSNSPFLDTWKDSMVSTGVTEIDELLVDNQFYIEQIFEWSDDEFIFVARRDDGINNFRLSKLLQNTGYFNYVEMNGHIGDGDDIYVKFKEGFLEVTYIYGYGDCPSGCTFADFYTFRVYQDGRVTYEGKTTS